MACCHLAVLGLRGLWGSLSGWARGPCFFFLGFLEWYAKDHIKKRQTTLERLLGDEKNEKMPRQQNSWPFKRFGNTEGVKTLGALVAASNRLVGFL